MYTFEDAVNMYMPELPEGLKARYNKDMYSDKHPFYCPDCGWYYPHDNWPTNKCPKCSSINITQVNNCKSTFGLFA